MPTYCLSRVGGLSRRRLLTTGAAAVAGATGLGALASPARAGLPDNDLAWLRLLVACELVGAAFYASAQKARPYGRPGMAELARAAFNEREHYAAVAALLAASGQTPATAADIDFTYPNRSFTTVAAVTQLAVTLETIFLGAYLGAVGDTQDASLKQPLARIAASQAEHLTVWRRLLGRRPFALSFPDALTIDEASAALDAYTA